MTEKLEPIRKKVIPRSGSASCVVWLPRVWEGKTVEIREVEDEK